MADPKKVFCIVDHFLPGFKGGGPIRTIANMRDLLIDSVQISIFTRDRDLGSNLPFDSIPTDTWIKTEQGPIFYASPKMFGADGLKNAMANKTYDLIYLNSFFSFRSSISAYFWLRKTKQDTPILLAPRGEFSSGALSIKSAKKQTFLKTVKLFGFYRDVQWHASTHSEKTDIMRQFPSAEGKIHVAEDPVCLNFSASTSERHPPSQSGHLRLAFISRISPMKNLDGLLRILATITCQTQIDIFGPVEDLAYWEKCKRLIAELPPNTRVSYKNELEANKVSSTFANYDLFALPTRGENFGHVIFEALRAGTPVLTSDQTSWQTDPSGALTAVPLDKINLWRDKLHEVADRSAIEKANLRIAARTYAEAFVQHSGIREKNLSMFIAAIRHQHGSKPL